MPIQGAVADRVRALIPVTWDALEKDQRVGDSALQSAIDLAKNMTTGQAITPVQEQNYPVIAVDYMAKLAIIEICNTAADFWMNQSLSVSATGTNENLSYVDRAQRIESLKQEYLEETREKYSEVATLIGYWIDN